MDWSVTAVWMFTLVVAVSAQCDPVSFVSFDNQHIIGGTLDTTAADLSTCQNNCLSDASCFAVDVSQNPLRCYSLRDPTASLQPESLVTHYRLTRSCRSGTTTCRYSGFSTYTFAANYYTEETQLSFENCALSCTAKGNSCQGFSYSAGQNLCRLATLSSAFGASSLVQNANWQTMKREDCTTECSPFFAKKTDKSSPNGVQQPTINSETGCKAACSQNSNCVAFDLDMTDSPPSCWIHVSASDLDVERDTPGISQYVIVERCPAGECQPSYSTLLNTNSPYGDLDSTITTESSCKLACASDWYCLGFDLVPSQDGAGSVQCWLHRNKTNFNQKRTTVGVTQYTLLDRCMQGSDITGTTTGAGCTTTFYKKANASSPFGSLVDGVSTETDCKAACIARTDCVAIDLDQTGLVATCWLHASTSDLNEQRNTVGISQYVKTTNCNTGTTTSMPSTTNQGCQINWDTIPNTSSVGAVLQTGITTAQECKDRCVLNKDCVAVDFNTVTTPAQCWFHFDSNKILNKRNDPGVDQYILDRCYQSGCKIFWSNATATKSVGALLQSGITTLEACLNECIRLASCVAVDFNFRSIPQQCWLHNDLNKLREKVSDTSVNQYVLDRCYNGNTCQIRWENITRTSSVGAMIQSNVVLLDDCLARCIADPTCVAVDYNFAANPQECWFHDDVNKVNDKRYDPQADQYILDRCYKAPCPKFNEFRDKHAIGGIQQSQALTKDSCEQICLNSMNCQGYDFDFNISGCFIFQMPKTPENLLPQSGTNHYELVCRAGETLPPYTTRPTCSPSWEVELNKHGIPGVYQPSIHTLAECQAQCVISAFCTAVDYVPAASQCYLFTEPYSLVSSRSGVNHYALTRCAATTSSWRGTTSGSL